jgi:hypothetical protein
MLPDRLTAQLYYDFLEITLPGLLELTGIGCGSTQQSSSTLWGRCPAMGEHDILTQKGGVCIVVRNDICFSYGDLLIVV